MPPLPRDPFHRALLFFPLLLNSALQQLPRYSREAHGLELLPCSVVPVDGSGRQSLPSPGLTVTPALSSPLDLQRSFPGPTPDGACRATSWDIACGSVAVPTAAGGRVLGAGGGHGFIWEADGVLQPEEVEDGAAHRATGPAQRELLL